MSKTVLVGGDGPGISDAVARRFVEGTAFDQAHATLEPSEIEGRFRALHTQRDVSSVPFG